jgi:hypothetical protein
MIVCSHSQRQDKKPFAVAAKRKTSMFSNALAKS